ncbi:MAG TPA: hypothetical protein VE990_16370, partial [Acidimicrobiales bacterium]|nr:hypothetical protein [Acidimicrobiales bacterium]
AMERDRASHSRLVERRSSLEARAARLEGEAQSLQARLDASADAAPRLAEHARRAADDLRRAEEHLEATEAASADAARSHHGWQARAEALALALDQAAARAGAERLAGLAGLVGTLAELVEVDPGWEAAFEAAAGEALVAVVVEDVQAARTALRRLAADGATGAVLVLGLSRPRTGAPSAGDQVRAHVRSGDPRVESLLDAVLGGAVVVGDWEEALTRAAGEPDRVVLSAGGDRFAPTGWRTGAAGSGATGAALDEARQRAEEALAAAGAAAQAAEQARADLARARAAHQQAAAALAAGETEVGEAEAGLARARVALQETAGERQVLDAELAEIGARLEAEAAERSQLESRLPELEHRERAMVEASASRRAAARRLEELAAAAATLRTDLEVRAAGLEERRRVLATRLAEVEDRLRSHVAERQQAAARRTRLEATVVALDRLAVLVRAHDLQLEAGAAELRERRRRQAEHTRAASEHLDGLRRRRSEAERTLEQVRERAQRAAIEEAEARLRLETIVETIRRDLDCEPAVAKAASCPALPEGASAQGRLRDLEREIRLLGPVNPLALEEHAALQERHGFLESQLEDVKSSRRELAKVIRAIDVEIIDVFAAAYADVSDNFTKLFATLFPGGSGHLRLTDPDNLLETGIEIEGRPSGKNVRRLSLLSGGERSLIAIAFLFAVFRSRPSPFYLMDEVEAALDDVNLHRFLDLVHEFRDEAQLLIVSHQKRTMEAADCLYGVTMQPGGSSKVISEKIAAHT